MQQRTRTRTRWYTHWLSGVQDGRYDHAPLTAHQYKQITRYLNDKHEQTLARRSYLRGYKRGVRARLNYTPVLPAHLRP